MFISKYKLVSKAKKDNNISYYTKRKKLAMFHIKNYLHHTVFIVMNL